MLIDESFCLLLCSLNYIITSMLQIISFVGILIDFTALKLNVYTRESIRWSIGRGVIVDMHAMPSVCTMRYDWKKSICQQLRRTLLVALVRFELRRIETL
jgi:hypothetical protein